MWKIVKIGFVFFVIDRVCSTIEHIADAKRLNTKDREELEDVIRFCESYVVVNDDIPDGAFKEV